MLRLRRAIYEIVDRKSDCPDRTVVVAFTSDGEYTWNVDVKELGVNNVMAHGIVNHKPTPASAMTFAKVYIRDNPIVSGDHT